MHSPLTKQESVICDLDGARAALWSQVLEEHQKQADEFLFMGDPVNSVQTNNSIYLSMQKKIKFNSRQPGKSKK